MVIQLVENEGPGDSTIDEASNILTYVAIAGIGIILVVGAVIFVMRGSDEEDGGSLGGFGDA